MDNTFLDALLLFAPAGIANVVPVLVAKAPVLRNWEAPMDFGRSFRGTRIFGDHKTWRGLITGVIGGTLFGLAVYQVNDFDKSLGIFLVMSAVVSTGALFGDAIKSFFKRRIKVAPGKAWFPLDQVDYIIGGLLCLLPFGVLTWPIVINIILLYFGLHILSSYIGYLLGLKSSPI